MKLALTKQMGLLLFLLAAIVFVQTALVYRQFKTTEFFGPFLSVAGRQRLLAQRIELLRERLPCGEDEDRRVLLDTMAQIDETIRVFVRGGQISAYRLPPVPEPVRETLERHQRLWSDELSPFLKEQLVSTPEQIHYSDSPAKGKALTQKFLDSSIQLMDAFVNWRVDTARGLLEAAIGMSALAVLLLVAAVLLGWARIVAPVRDVKDRLSRVVPRENLALNDIKDIEIESVAELVTEVEAGVGRLQSERDEIEEELRQVEADYRSIFLNAVVGIVQMDRTGRIVAANPAVARILGYESLSDFLAEVTNAHEQIFVDPDHRGKIDPLRTAQSGAFEIETEARRKDGGTIWVLESGNLVKSEDGEFSHYELVLIDITPRKRAQDSLRELSGLLLRSQEEERRRIGRDLHDSTGQLLAALQMSLDRLKKSFETLSDKDREVLNNCAKLAEQCSQEVRSVSHLLHPPLLEELGLEFALREYVGGFEERSGIRVRLDIAPELGRLSPEAETGLFRLVQEALTNIHRHAGSSSADIRLDVVSDEIRLVVKDQGRGFPRELLDAVERPSTQMGVGMRGMEERLSQLGGRLTIESGDWGSRIRAELPKSQNLHEVE
jgi:PAS domain S-box-containing protein